MPGIQFAFRHPSLEEYYGGWEGLVFYLFPPSEGYCINIVPGYSSADLYSGHSDFTVTYHVFVGNAPICIIEVRRETYLRLPSLRAATDEHIRTHAKEMILDAPSYVKMVFFLSCIGRRFALYRLDLTSHEIIPALRVENGRTLPPSEGWWRWNVLHPRGEQYLRRLATTVKQIADKYRRDNVILLLDKLSDDIDQDYLEDAESDDEDPLVNFVLLSSP
jgi:hypothetical protein